MQGGGLGLNSLFSSLRSLFRNHMQEAVDAVRAVGLVWSPSTPPLPSPAALTLVPRCRQVAIKVHLSSLSSLKCVLLLLLPPYPSARVLHAHPRLCQGGFRLGVTSAALGYTVAKTAKRRTACIEASALLVWCSVRDREEVSAEDSAKYSSRCTPQDI